MNPVLKKEILTDNEVFEYFQTLVDKNYVEYAYADLFADVIGISQKKLNSITKKKTGKTACQLVEEKIVSVTVELLKQSNLSIKKIAEQLGYEDQYYFYRMFKKQTGFPPSQFRIMLKAVEK